MHDDQGLDAPPTVPFETDGPPPTRTIPWFPAVLLALGLFIGGMGGWLAKPAVEVIVPRDLTADEVAATCAPQVETHTAELSQVKDRVAVLEREVTEKQARVEELETRRSVAGSALVAQLDQAKKELAQARQELEAARQEKEKLATDLSETRTTLEQTQSALVEQSQRTLRAQEDALVNKWYRFVNDAQLDICEKGSRKKVGECRELVTTALRTEARRNRFAHCVRSGQAVPVVQAIDKDASPPTYAEPVTAADRDLREWVVMFCDPTLPERTDGFLDETHLPGAALSAVSGATSS